MGLKGTDNTITRMVDVLCERCGIMTGQQLAKTKDGAKWGTNEYEGYCSLCQEFVDLKKDHERLKELVLSVFTKQDFIEAKKDGKTI